MVKKGRVKIRALEEKDLKGYLNVLRNLSPVYIKEKKAKEIFNRVCTDGNYVIHVAEVNSKIVGATTLLIEQKFSYRGRLVGHIEDVVVDPKYRNMNIGEKIVKSLLDHAEKRKCHKTILDCDPDLIPFYAKNKFKFQSVCVRHNHGRK